MEKFDRYRVELKNMTADSAEYEFQLDNQFFAEVEGPEVQKGQLTIKLCVRKRAGVYLLDFQTEGTVTVLCDRCLDEMDLPVSSADQLKVKLGEEYGEEGDIVTVPEEDGAIDVSWYMYEFIALSIPIQHVHEPGQCNEDMAAKLREHLRTSGDDEEMDMDLSAGTDTDEEPRETDPRWNELKKILDNN